MWSVSTCQAMLKTKIECIMFSNIQFSCHLACMSNQVSLRIYCSLRVMVQRRSEIPVNRSSSSSEWRPLVAWWMYEPSSLKISPSSGADVGVIGLLCKENEHDAKITADNHDIIAARSVAELQYENNRCRVSFCQIKWQLNITPHTI